MESLIEFFQKVLARAVQVKASDIHLSVGSPWKYRLDGHITSLKTKPLEAGEIEAIVRHILLKTSSYTPESVDGAIATMHDFDCSYSLPGVSRFRVNICRQRGSFSVVLRIVSFLIPSIEELELPEVIKDIAMEERGLILVTGITGAGKSTTLAAMINLINQTKPCKIITIEDPIEFLHREIKSSIIQREVGSDTESFAIALRGALRQDPDVILVGEMRDTITIETALKAAETGHLVLSTLHTMDASKTIQRIISAFDLGEQQTIRMRLADALKAAISQRLLRKKDGTGRIAVLEVLRNTLAIKDCIENPEKTGNIMDFMASGGDSYGMQTFDQHLMSLFKKDIIDLATARAAATSPADFERNIIFA